MAFNWLKQIFQKNDQVFQQNDLDETELEKFYSQKVLKSEQVNRPGFDKYFVEVVDAEGAYWGEDGYLYQGEEEKEFVTFGRFNDRMNQKVCKTFGKEKCEKIAKNKGWHYEHYDWGVPVGSMSYKEDSWPVKWYDLHDALVNL